MQVKSKIANVQSATMVTAKTLTQLCFVTVVTLPFIKSAMAFRSYPKVNGFVASVRTLVGVFQ